MYETEFWEALEYRICAELKKETERKRRHLWCDGLTPEDYDFKSSPAEITGVAFCGNGGNETWAFTLVMPNQPKDRTHVDWASLMPTENKPGWLKLDVAGRRMDIRPGGASPDAG